MTVVRVYSSAARKRINRAVKWFETRPRGGVQHGRTGVAGANTHTFALATEDIEHDSFGDVRLATANTMDSTYDFFYADTANVRNVFNPGHKIWSGSRVLLVRAFLAGADPPDNTKWAIAQAWSATRIRGSASANIIAGGTGTLTNLRPLDGTFQPLTLTCTLPTQHVAVDAGLKVWVELVCDPTTGVSAWEVYSADCDEAGE